MKYITKAQRIRARLKVPPGQRRFLLLALAGAAVLLCLGGAPLYGATYEINWYTVDGGGGASAGGGYTLTGTVGQPDAGTMSGGNFSLQGGFWSGAGELESLIITRIASNRDGTMTVEWVGGGTLQASLGVAGAWQDVTEAHSPYTFTPTTPALFLRVRR
jgi:hypothetical protein